MRIASFWAKGYRSLRDVRIDGLGAFNVFYGPNGSGKSNILEGIRTLFGLVSAVASEPPPDFSAASTKSAVNAIKEGFVGKRDLSAHDPSRTIVLGAKLVEDAGGLPVLVSQKGPLRELTLEVTLNWIIEREPKLRISVLKGDGEDLLASRRQEIEFDELAKHYEEDERDAESEFANDLLRALLLDTLPSRAFGLVGADRSPRAEQLIIKVGGEQVVASYLRKGHLKSALFAARNHPSHEVRRKLDAFRKLLAGPPLHRPPFEPVQDPLTGEIDLREQLPDPNPEGRDVSLDLAGLGITQIYFILAQAMLLGTRAVGIEEPEAHLHAPTSGRALRQLLVRLVEEKHIDQLFIATHSNLFDLDPTGYFDVSLKDGCTVVERADLTRIDHDHLYEPGPAKHALARMLSYAPPDEVIFRRADGSPVTAQEMLKLLQEDDEVAVDFLKDVHGAAVRMVKVQAKRAPGG